MTQPEPFEVYAIRYATMARTSAENFIGGDPHESASRLDYFVWLARNALSCRPSATNVCARPSISAVSVLGRGASQSTKVCFQSR